MRLELLIPSIAGSAAILVWRARETARPTNASRILLPPIAMSTGLLMFVYPPARIPVGWAAAAFGIGALGLSWVLVATSKLVREGDAVMLRRSPAFLAILLGLVAIRLIARAYIEQYVDAIQTGSIFFLLALGMIVVWRANMFVRYRQLLRGASTPTDSNS
ncbi:MAG: cytochrome c biogenesis protein CcdC [Polyangiaceae bacterium]